MSYQFGSVDPGERIAPSGQEEGPGRRPLLASALVILVMAVFAGGLWFAYHAGERRGSTEVPLIRAERTPIKVRPSSPGGLKIPDQNMLIYNEREPRIEQLLPGPERPLPRPVAEPPAAAPKPAATPRAVPASPNPAATLSPAPPAPQPKTAEPSPRTTPAPLAAPPAARSTPAVHEGTRIQLGALKSKAAARAEWELLKRANPQILGRLSAQTVRADLGGKGVFYRVEAGPFASPAEAAKICGRLKRRKIACFPVQ